MTSPNEWRELLDGSRPWQDVYPEVSEVARVFLETLAPDIVLTTPQLVKGLWPECEHFAWPSPGNRLMRALRACSTRGLSDCCTLESGKLYGRTVRRRLWHAPERHPLPTASLGAPLVLADPAVLTTLKPWSDLLEAAENVSRADLRWHRDGFTAREDLTEAMAELRAAIDACGAQPVANTSPTLVEDKP